MARTVGLARTVRKKPELICEDGRPLSDLVDDIIAGMRSSGLLSLMTDGPKKIMLTVRVLEAHVVAAVDLD